MAFSSLSYLEEAMVPSWEVLTLSVSREKTPTLIVIIFDTTKGIVGSHQKFDVSSMWEVPWEKDQECDPDWGENPSTWGSSNCTSAALQLGLHGQ